MTRVTETELSPLDQIRLAEAENLRQVLAAREAAGQVVARAHAHAAQLKKQAQETGRREGQIRYKEIVSKAEEEARLIAAQAHGRADDLRRQGRQRMELAVRRAVEIVIGQPGEEEAK